MPDGPKRYKVRAKPGVRKFSLNKSAEGARPNAGERGYGHKWQRAAKLFLLDNPCCAKCEEKDIVTEATCVDHIVPHRGNDVLFWELSNWQALCATCHNRKTGQGQ